MNTIVTRQESVNLAIRKEGDGPMTGDAGQAGRAPMHFPSRPGGAGAGNAAGRRL